jgi:hypothetical protein
MEELLVQFSGFPTHQAFFNLNAVCLKASNSRAGNLGIGITSGHKHSPNTPLQDEFGTRGRSAYVTARFQSHIEITPLRSCPRLVQSDDFGVPELIVNVVALADDLSIPHDHRTDHRIWPGPPQAPPGQPQGAGHVLN